MKNERTDKSGHDAALAHGLARVGLGINIAMHGYTRLPGVAGFANNLVKQFASTLLPGPVVYITGYGIAIGEAALGTLLFFGVFVRPALSIGALLMLLLLFGSTLIQQWEVASIQMIYIAFYAALLATASYDRFSVDRLLRKQI